MGELVLLNSKHIKVKLPKGGTRKLHYKHIGPFPIAPFEHEGPGDKVSYRLELPSHKKIHDVFHVSLLKKYDPSRLKQPPPCELDEDGEELFAIERILDHRTIPKGRIKNGARQYLIRWQGFHAEWDSWEPEENIAVSEGGLTIQRFWEYLGQSPEQYPLGTSRSDVT